MASHLRNSKTSEKNNPSNKKAFSGKMDFRHPRPRLRGKSVSKVNLDDVNRTTQELAIARNMMLLDQVQQWDISRVIATCKSNDLTYLQTLQGKGEFQLKKEAKRLEEQMYSLY